VEKQTQNLLSLEITIKPLTMPFLICAAIKIKKGKQDYVILLEEAFAKAKERDLNAINLLAKEANPAQLEKNANTYVQLNSVRKKIKPLLPLKFKEGRNAIFPLIIITIKSSVVKCLISLFICNAKINGDFR
jgi:hypothetical protein